MRNLDVMKKVKELDLQPLHTREQSAKVMIQIAIIRKAFGVKNNETNMPVIDYERKVVLSDDEIRKEYQKYLQFLNWSIEKQDLYKQREFTNQIDYFVDAVEFFNKDLAEEFKAIINKWKMHILISNIKDLLPVTL